MIKNKFLRILSFFTFPAIVFCVSMFLGNFFDIFTLVNWIDIPIHFLGGISIAYTCFLFLKFFEEQSFLKIKRKFVFVLIIFSLVSLVAVFWEFWEWGMKNIFLLNWQQSLDDTLLDLFMGMSGGLSFALFKKFKCS